MRTTCPNALIKYKKDIYFPIKVKKKNQQKP